MHKQLIPGVVPDLVYTVSKKYLIYGLSDALISFFFYKNYYWGEPTYIDELNVRNLYIYVYYYGTSVTARRYIQCTATRDIFRRPHEETSALSGTTCTIIAESAKQILVHSVCLSQNLSRERPSTLIGHAPALPGMPSY